MGDVAPEGVGQGKAPVQSKRPTNPPPYSSHLPLFYHRHTGQLSARQYHRSAAGSEGSIRRLELQRTLPSDMKVDAISFTANGERLIAGSCDEDITVWDWERGVQDFRYPSGHLDTISDVRSLPGSGGKTIISCGRDHQVRCAVVKPDGVVHTEALWKCDRVIRKLAMDVNLPGCFLSCGDDGVVRQYDLRQRKRSETLFTCRKFPESTAGSSGGLRDKNHKGPSPLRLSTIAVNPVRPHLFALGGNDELARVYDLRKSSPSRWWQARGGVDRPVDLFAPRHLLAGTREEWRYTIYITGVAFSVQSELLISYQHELIYLFGEKQGYGPTPPGPPYPKNKDKGRERGRGSGGVVERGLSIHFGVPEEGNESEGEGGEGKFGGGSSEESEDVGDGEGHESMGEREEGEGREGEGKDMEGEKEDGEEGERGNTRQTKISLSSFWEALGGRSREWGRDKERKGSENEGGKTEGGVMREKKFVWKLPREGLTKNGKGVATSPAGQEGKPEETGSDEASKEHASNESSGGNGPSRKKGKARARTKEKRGRRGQGWTLGEEDEEEKEEEDSEGVGEPLQAYEGHWNGHGGDPVTFFGLQSEYVVSTSSLDHVYIWKKKGGKLVAMLLPTSMNLDTGLEAHPSTTILATGGLQTNIWAPTWESGKGLPSDVTEIMQRNRQKREDINTQWAPWRRAVPPF